jgi:uncharacterized protein YodC (DUF2158 family)
MEFAPGDLVSLKSGGPTMTVEQVGDTQLEKNVVWVVWFEKVGQKQVVQRETFAPVLLEKIEPSLGSMRVTRG